MPTLQHPLDPLQPNEVTQTTKLIQQEFPKRGLSNDKKRFIRYAIVEPPKQQVYSFKQGQPFDRKIFCVVLDNLNKSTYEIVVSLTHKKVVEWVEKKNVQPLIIMDEFIECEQACKSDPRLQKIFKERGLNPEYLMIDPWCAGYFGDKWEKGKRLLRTFVWCRRDSRDHGYSHPVEGLQITVDLHEMKVIDIYDDRKIPIPWRKRNYAYDQYIKDGGKMREPLKPLEIVQPEGPSFKVNGNHVQWDRWDLRVGFCMREGLTLHDIRFHDRPVCFRASIPEMVVPYGSPDKIHSRKMAFDVGDYGIGMLTNSLVLGCDCLGEIYYFDGVISNGKGEPIVIKNAICMHEEDAGLLWKHHDWRLNSTDLRRSRRLVISSIATIGNYEYGYYWYFYQDGTFELEVKFTGIVNTNGVHPSVRKTKYGTVLSEGLEAQIHQHWHCVRLDMCVDGIQNSVSEVNVYPEENDAINFRKTAFYTKKTKLRTEVEARRRINTKRARTWDIFNPNKRNAMGRPVTYALHPGLNSFPYAHPSSWFMKRASWLKYHFWVTRFNEHEKYPSGEHPNQSDGKSGGMGLEAMSNQNRNIENTDCVIWYVFGATHVVRLEDFPVMPVVPVSAFKLRPNGFFNENPTLDVPPPQKKSCHIKSKL